ncbi:MAG: glycosyltransferase family 4 protein [Anaerolinea sp.]|nr:glycosyltransferase family 4 protein [Anaerolinea sp.]
MRILYFTRDYTPHDHRFLSSLAETGHTIYSLRLERRGMAREDRPLPANVEQLLWRGGQGEARLRDYPALAWDLQRLIRKLRPDVIHAGPVQSAAFLAALTGFRPLVTMSWGSDLLRDADAQRFRTRFTLRRTTVLLGDCVAVRDKAASFGFDPQRTVLFPWGIDLQRFTLKPAEPVQTSTEDPLRAALGWDGDAFTLLCLRAWEPIYGVDVVVRAFGRAAQQAPQLRLFLLSGGSMAKQLREILLRFDVLDRVVFGGQVTQTALPGYYHASDLYISASHSDGSSVSLMEALASGVPVLVSDIPGNREWITPGVQGWLFPDGDDVALSEGILNALRQRSELPAMGRAGRALAEQRADWRKNFARLLEGYDMAVTLAKRERA